ncbi:MAG TPA: hypothetical protein VK631_04960, partial [Solirubrobacteraceae bacterium]|nr:hypothetical protein [Solirubrobacteraceae bacterium]
GGNVVGESVSDRSPGQEYPSASGGDKTLEPITIGRRVKLERDNDDFYARLHRHASVEDAIIINRKPLGSDNNPVGKGRTWTGTITNVNEPDSDTNSENEPAVVEITMQPSGVA